MGANQTQQEHFELLIAIFILFETHVDKGYFLDHIKLPVSNDIWYCFHRGYYIW